MLYFYFTYQHETFYKPEAFIIIHFENLFSPFYQLYQTRKSWC